MAYSQEIAYLLTQQLLRFVTLNPHQLAGQVANLDFWMEQVLNCQRVIDGYPKRFEALKQAEMQHAQEHHTVEFDLDDRFGTSAHPPPRPRRVPSHELSQARKELCDAAYRFLIRCYSARLISEEKLRECCKLLDISIAPSDL